MALKPNSYISLIFFFLFLNSCDDKSKMESLDNSLPVIINKYSSYGLDFSDTKSLMIMNTDSIKIHYYGMTYDESGEMESYLEVPYGIDHLDSSYILINYKRAKLVDSKVYTVEKEKIKVQKYYFNLTNELDEESYYFVANGRIVALNLIRFNLQKFYLYDHSKIDFLLKNYSTDFFNF